MASNLDFDIYIFEYMYSLKHQTQFYMMSKSNIVKVSIHQNRTRRQILDKALSHLTNNYYPKLQTEGKRTFSRQYIPTTEGEFVEGLVVVGQRDGFLLASVRTLDSAYFDRQNQELDIHASMNNNVHTYPVLVSALITLFGFFTLTYIVLDYTVAFIMAALFGMMIYMAIDRNNAQYKRIVKLPIREFAAMMQQTNTLSNELWLAIGIEVFAKHPQLDLRSTADLCNSKGWGLLIIDTEGGAKVYANPNHSSHVYERKYDSQVFVAA